MLMDEKHQGQVVQYKIPIKGQIPEHQAVRFDGLSITCTKSGETLIAGPVEDQATLHGLLAKICDLNLTLISVN